MSYKVLQPFTNGTEQYRAGQVIGDEIEQVRNFTRLLGGPSRTLRPYLECVTGESTDGCFIIRKKFGAGGRELKPGDFVDTRDNPWRNEVALLSSQWIRRATESEVRIHTAQPSETGADSVDAIIKTPVEGPAGAGNPPRPLAAESKLGVWEDETWLRNEYSTKTITQIANEQGCSTATIHRALKKHGIKSRPRGRQE